MYRIKYSCHNIERSCTCSFAVSSGLPCQHIMFVWYYGHGFEELATITISSSWRMADATKVYMLF
ncbi:hypothetical protein PHMEG_00018868 [Phytophthora megakarya]|uniref:SWIM-type domain-containing protein n=1 Tax=Phytophthora megakarya TaxID=4795 RepID=A0A225VTB1_9STRA|nr:hypothetical protein PHMEG_00018868 [Phytophthora megakarya]